MKKTIGLVFLIFITAVPFAYADLAGSATGVNCASAKKSAAKEVQTNRIMETLGKKVKSVKVKIGECKSDPKSVLYKVDWSIDIVYAN